MNAEIVAVGTELLLGQIANTNGAYLAQKLAGIGINVYYQTVVGDNPKRLEAVFKTAQKRSDLVILIGGLGPTKDDLTKQVVADALGEDLVTDEDALAKITAFQEQSGRLNTPNNQLQALKLAHADTLPNATGFAVGDLYRDPDGADVVLLPGPPSEFTVMVDQQLMPRLMAQGTNQGVIFSKVMRFIGIGESELVTNLGDLIDAQTNPTIAPYAKVGEVTLRITATAKTQAEAEDKVNGMVDDVLERDRQYFYGYGDDNSLAQVVVHQLIDAQLTVTAAESLTAGEFQSTLGDVPGVSAVFPGGFVTYANEAKVSLLSIPQHIVDDFGVVSEETAVWMAQQAKLKLATDVAISFTGVAGPDKLEGQPAGTVWIGIAFKDQPAEAHLYHFANGRAQIRRSSVLTGLDLIRQKLTTD